MKVEDEHIGRLIVTNAWEVPGLDPVAVGRERA
jgi:hypothetical protein